MYQHLWRIGVFARFLHASRLQEILRKGLLPQAGGLPQLLTNLSARTLRQGVDWEALQLRSDVSAAQQSEIARTGENLLLLGSGSEGAPGIRDSCTEASLVSVSAEYALR